MIKPKILVADNLPSFLESFSKSISRSGRFEVLKASRPELAEEELKKHLVHLALVDVRMRKDDNKNDRSGLQLCERMDPTVARILITEHTDRQDSWQIVREASKPIAKRHRLADGFFSKKEVADSKELIINEIQRVLDEEFEIIPRLRIGVLTSGGDAPGMNAAIWAIVRTATNNDIEVMGIENGYEGLVTDQMRKLKWGEMSDIVEQSGTFLGAARFPNFKNPKIRKKAVENILRKHISGLIIIGGDGSMKGAQALANDVKKQRKRLLTVAIPGTIDNDLWGTDMSLGAASAANAMIEEMRNMIQPAKALRRIFVCEVMGANCGYLALEAALGIAADVVIIPEQIIEVRTANQSTWAIDYRKTERTYLAQMEKTVELLEAVFTTKKRYAFVVVAEGIEKLTQGRKNADSIAKYLEGEIEAWPETNRPDVRVQKLGYTVRGVPPTQFDVRLAAALGAESVLCILRGETNCMVGWKEGEGIVTSPFDEVVPRSNVPPQQVLADRPKWQETLQLQQALACPPKFREQLVSQGNRFAKPGTTSTRP